MNEAGYQPKAVLWARSLCPAGAEQRQEEVIDRLQRMEETNRIDGFEIEIWGDRIPLDTQLVAGTGLLEQVQTFQAWSNDAGTSLAPFFQKREGNSSLTGTSRDGIIPPVICLAEYDNSSLQYVTPCIDHGSICTVSDRLNTIDRPTHEIEQQRNASD
jgi:hypothetical protein